MVGVLGEKRNLFRVRTSDLFIINQKHLLGKCLDVLYNPVIYFLTKFAARLDFLNIIKFLNMII